MKRYSCVVLLAVGLTGGHGAWAESLDDALSATYLGNPALNSRRAAMRATDEAVPQALASWRPTVTLGGSDGRGSYSSTTRSNFNVARSPVTQTVTVSQNLYQGGRTVVATRQARNTVAVGRAQLASTEQTVLLSAAQAYLDAIRDEQILAHNIKNEQVLRVQYEAVAERLKVRDATLTDVNQADARLAGAIYSRTTAESALANSRANFIKAVGHPAQGLSLPDRPQSLPDTLPVVLRDSRAGNPDVLAARYSVDAAQDGIALIEGELLPSVNLNGDVTRGLQGSTPYDQTNNREVVLSVSVPLYTGGGTFSRLRAQKETVSQLILTLEDTKNTVSNSANTAWESLQSARAQIAWLEHQIKANEQALLGVEAEARIGIRTVIEVLNAQQELFTSQVNLVTARHDELLAAYQLRLAMGQMTAKSLALDVPFYDPVPHASEVEGKWFGLGSDPIQ